MTALRETTDGRVVIRPPAPGDAEVLVAGRDPVFHRFMGAGSETPEPTGCILVGGEIVGWVDFDVDRTWLDPGAVNVGYNVFAPHRGQGHATRAVHLLLHHLAVDTPHHTATLAIDPGNERSLALARRAGFTHVGTVDDSLLFRRPVPPLVYTGGGVTIRRRAATDLDADLGAKDEEQIRWLWQPGQRERWQAMTPGERRAHALRGLRADHDAFGTGPRWTFAVDATDGPGVARVDCDLASDQAPAGEANISYASHPAHRGHGHVSAAVRLVLRFLAEHTGARQGHLVVDAANLPSLRLAAAVGAVASERWLTPHGRTMIRHVVPVRSQAQDA